MKISELVKILHIEGFTRPDLVIDPYAHFLKKGHNGEIITYLQKIVDECRNQIINDEACICRVYPETRPWNSAHLIKSCVLPKSYSKIENKGTNLVIRTVEIDIRFPKQYYQLIIDKLFVKILSVIDKDYPVFPYEHRYENRIFDDERISLDIGIVYPLSMEGEYQNLPPYNLDAIKPDYASLFRSVAEEVYAGIYAAGESNLVCPTCKKPLLKYPNSKIKCKYCGTLIYPFRDLYSGKQLLLTEEWKKKIGKYFGRFSLEEYIDDFNRQNVDIYRYGYLNDRWKVLIGDNESKCYLCGSEDEIEGLKYVLSGHHYIFGDHSEDYEEIDEEFDKNKLRVLNQKIRKHEINGDIIVQFAAKVKTGNEYENEDFDKGDFLDLIDWIDEDSVYFYRIEYKPVCQNDVGLVVELNIFDIDEEYQNNLELLNIEDIVVDSFAHNTFSYKFDGSENIGGENKIYFSIIIPKRHIKIVTWDERIDSLMEQERFSEVIKVAESQIKHIDTEDYDNLLLANYYVDISLFILGRYTELLNRENIIEKLIHEFDCDSLQDTLEPDDATFMAYLYYLRYVALQNTGADELQIKTALDKTLKISPNIADDELSKVILKMGEKYQKSEKAG